MPVWPLRLMWPFWTDGTFGLMWLFGLMGPLRLVGPFGLMGPLRLVGREDGWKGSQARWLRIWRLMRDSIAAMPRSRSGLTRSLSPS
jgi:hypothetical protein